MGAANPHPLRPGSFLRRILLMQANDSLQVSPRIGVQLGRAAFARLRSAGVAQPVEHLFCKQVVRGSSPLASSSFARRPPLREDFARKDTEGCPSGQREQAVNLPANAYVGSNPTPSTFAGVAQLVERQPSKLNVVGSSPISRSIRSGLGRGYRRSSAPAAGCLPVGLVAASSSRIILGSWVGLKRASNPADRRASHRLYRRATACLIQEACKARPPYRFPLPT
jgi:hypothetical protein